MDWSGGVGGNISSGEFIFHMKLCVFSNLSHSETYHHLL